MRLSPARFDRWLNKIGEQFQWRKSYSCPCINPASGAAKHNCANCSGKGRFWVDPIQGVSGVAGNKVQREWAQFGVWQNGDLVLTIQESSPLYNMGQFDRVTMLNGTHEFDLVLTRGDNDRLFFQVSSIDRVFWYDSNGDIVEGGIPTVNPDGTLTWATGEPPAATQYSISGWQFTEYFVWGQFPANRNMHSGARLPKRVVVRLFDLFGR